MFQISILFLISIFRYILLSIDLAVGAIAFKIFRPNEDFADHLTTQTEVCFCDKCF